MWIVWFPFGIVNYAISSFFSKRIVKCIKHPMETEQQIEWILFEMSLLNVNYIRRKVYDCSVRWKRNLHKHQSKYEFKFKFKSGIRTNVMEKMHKLRKAISSLIFKKFPSLRLHLVWLWFVVGVCCYVCASRHLTLSLLSIFLCWTVKCDSLNEEEKLNRNGMYIPSSEKNWYYFIGLEQKRNNTYIRRSGK